MDPEQLKRFDEASNHPYECKCELCKEWWTLVPPEDDEQAPSVESRAQGAVDPSRPPFVHKLGT